MSSCEVLTLKKFVSIFCSSMMRHSVVWTTSVSYVTRPSLSFVLCNFCHSQHNLSVGHLTYNRMKWLKSFIFQLHTAATAQTFVTVIVIITGNSVIIVVICVVIIIIIIITVMFMSGCILGHATPCKRIKLLNMH